MKILRRVLGVLVMLAGLLGLVLSLAGVVVVWVAKPVVTDYARSTIDTLNASVATSQSVMEVTGQALGATIDSVDALSDLLSTTAATVEDTKPVLDKIDTVMSTTLPSSLQAATDSLYTAQEAARVLESTIQSLDSFRFLLSATPLVADLMPPPEQPYAPEKPMADTLGELATNLQDLPGTFVEMSADLSATDDKLAAVQENLVTMSDSVGLISSSLGEYKTMVAQSRSSMGNLKSILTGVQNNLPTILNVAAIVLSLFFAWLLAAQIVILSQGWELYQGTADRMASEAE
jgi:uncharacterized coiled-coil protein SlyX